MFLASHKRKLNTKLAFSLVELMIAVSILSIGIVAVVRSLLTSAQAIDSLNNRVRSMQILDEKLNFFKEEITKGDLDNQSDEEEIKLNIRPASLYWKISKIQSKAGEDTPLKEIDLKLSWKESGQEKESKLNAYFLKK